MVFKRVMVILLLAFIIGGCNNNNSEPPGYYAADLLYVYTDSFWVTGTTSISAEVLGDDGTGRINKKVEATFDYYIDDVFVLSEVTTDSKYDWNTNSYPDGIHKIIVKAKTAKGEMQETREINVRHYFPQITVYTYPSYLNDEIRVRLYKWTDFANAPSTNANIKANGVDLVWDPFWSNYKQPESYYTWSKPGDEITFLIEPFDAASNEVSVTVPYPFRNIRSSDINKWISGADSNLTLTWELPQRDLDYVVLYLYCYDSSGNIINFPRELAQWDGYENQIPTSYQISGEYLNPGTVYVTMRFEYIYSVILGKGFPEVLDNQPAYISAHTESRISNLPYNFVEKELALIRNQSLQRK